MQSVADGAGPTGAGAFRAGAMTELWYRNAVNYSLDVETFIDFKGDGIGDSRGLPGKLDYLAALVVRFSEEPAGEDDGGRR